MDYKTKKELFVQGLKGSSLNCIISLLFSIISSLGYWKLIRDKLISLKLIDESLELKGKSIQNYLLDSVLEIFTLVIPLLFFMTGYDEYTYYYNLSFFIILIFHNLFQNKQKLSSKHSKPKSNLSLANQTKFLHHVSNFRGMLMLLTSIAILAVDFKVFPRKLAKVETFGASLMDIGVGAFVFSSGLVAGRVKDHSKGSWNNLYKALYHSIPLWVLGIIRLISVKGLEYQEHVTEYGIHWNFFFTLGCLPIPIQIIELITSHLDYSGGIIILFYQLLLSFTGLQNYIISNDRIIGDWISMNREGLFSLFGYISIFLIAKHTGLILFNSQFYSTRKLIFNSIYYSCIFLISYHLLNIPISRRLCNLSYVSMVCSIILILLICLKLLQDQFRIKGSPFVTNAINYNGLSIFLIANLLTGLVNMSIPTLDVSDIVAYFILLGYICIVCIISLTLYKYQLKVLSF